MGTQVKDFMSTSVITTEATTSIGRIRTLMRRHKVHAIPVTESNGTIASSETSIRGIVTATDLCRDIDDQAAVGNIMPKNKVHVIPPSTSARSAAKMMLKQKVHHIVVMEEGRIVGMISSLDFVHLVAGKEFLKNKTAYPDIIDHSLQRSGL